MGDLTVKNIVGSYLTGKWRKASFFIAITPKHRVEDNGARQGLVNGAFSIHEVIAPNGIRIGYAVSHLPTGLTFCDPMQKLIQAKTLVSLLAQLPCCWDSTDVEKEFFALPPESRRACFDRAVAGSELSYREKPSR